MRPKKDKRSKAHRSPKRKVFFKIRVDEHISSPKARYGVFRFFVLKAESALKEPKIKHFRKISTSEYYYDREKFIKDLAIFMTLIVDKFEKGDCYAQAEKFIDDQESHWYPIMSQYGKRVEFIREVKYVTF